MIQNTSKQLCIKSIWIYQNEFKGSNTLGVCNINSIWYTNLDKRNNFFWKKSSENFLGVQPGWHEDIFKYHFYGQTFANWTILEHFLKNFTIQNIFGSSTKFWGSFLQILPFLTENLAKTRTDMGVRSSTASSYFSGLSSCQVLFVYEQ